MFIIGRYQRFWVIIRIKEIKIIISIFFIIGRYQRFWVFIISWFVNLWFVFNRLNIMKVLKLQKLGEKVWIISEW